MKENKYQISLNNIKKDVMSLASQSVIKNYLNLETQEFDFPNLQDLVDKSITMKPVISDYSNYACSHCDNIIGDLDIDYIYCPRCGQKLF
jgi:PHP family Zn ribbon phosphoesterase